MMSVLARSGVARRGKRAASPRVRRWRSLVLVVAWLAASAPLSGQTGAADSSLVPPDAVAGQAAAGGELPSTGISPLPPPATDRAYLHVFLAFGIAWALIFVYAVLLNRRIAAAERDMGRLTDRGA